MITAIYDCRSKQEYIYRTNKIREISGASLLLSHVYEMFIAKAEEKGIKIRNEWEKDFLNGIDFSLEKFEKSEYDGEVIYEGGGNLNVVYKSEEVYVKANRIFSRMLLEETYSVSIITAYTETTDNFNADREKLYREKNKQKNLGAYSLPCNVLPITQIDRSTFLPIAEKKYENNAPVSRTAEARHKRDAYKKYYNKDDELNTEALDSLVLKKGEDSMLAVIYIDGNDMGNKIKACTEGKNDYAGCVKALREFSLRTEEYFVERPIKAIEECLRKKNEQEKSGIEADPEKAHKYRRIIGGGDEITIICRAADAKDIAVEYFKALNETPPLADGKPNSSCAGIAVFHSHAPFSNIYEIAEGCCEMGKKKTRKSGSSENYIDFHYCHSGITNELEVIRAEQEQKYTARPYSLDEFDEMIRVGNILSEIGRSNIKALGESIVKGDPYYQFETERIKSRFREGFTELVAEYKNNEDRLKKLIYDISVVYDLWFNNGGEDIV